MFGLKESDIHALQQLLARYREVEKAVIYGSRAMGNYKSGSDVDIALIGEVSAETLAALSRELNEELPLPYKFDLIVY
jgi:predicted nucleotidyltransferase